MTELVVPADPVTWVLGYLRDTLLPAKFPSWTCGNRVPLGADGRPQTPAEFIRVECVGGLPDSAIADRPQIRFQFWGSDGLSDDHERTRVARSVCAHLRRDLGAVRASGVIALPDPTDTARSITQFTVTALLRGEQDQ